ncbi:amidohydrolase family protein [Cupriavidus nantongensis]|nr:amidohydrolase family protein [Cupriavidus nantongensis]
MNAQTNYLPVREQWLAKGAEPPIDPGLPIIDAHHHFYERPGWTYLADDYLADVRESGHNLEASVYMQALTRYFTDGPEHRKPVGETVYVAKATRKDERLAPQLCKGIVGYVDLRQGAAVREILEAHVAAGEGRFRGVRHLTTWDADTSLVNPLSAAPRGLLLDARYRAGVSQLAPMGLSYDAWLFFHQLPELADLARANPDTTIVVNHCGGVLGIGAYADPGRAVFNQWSTSMRALAQLPNVFVKLGGLGMRINGFGFDKGERPPSSLQLAQAWKPWIHSCIEMFGADRCMFESNFPVDKGSYPFGNGWNAFKRMTEDASAEEREALFRGTATSVYRLGGSDAASAATAR